MRLRRLASTLLLSLSLFVIFSNQFSVKAYAYNSDSFQFGNAWTLRTTSSSYNLQWQPLRDGSPIDTYVVSMDTGSKSYHLNNLALSDLSSLLFGSSSARFDFELLQDFYDYYLIFNLYSFDTSSPFNLSLDRIRFGYYDSSNVTVSSTDFNIIASGDRNDNGYTVICKIPDIPSAALNFFYLVGDIDIPSNLVVEGLFLSFEKDTDIEYVNSVITAINNQTTQITDKIDEVLTPEGEHDLDAAVGNITDQVQENLGALGFAHDTVENFIGLFNEEPPAPVINVPPLKMKIQGIEHQFFNGYQYDFRSLEEGGLSVLVGAVRTAGILVLWWAFLQYCLNEFDGFFRR